MLQYLVRGSLLGLVTLVVIAVVVFRLIRKRPAGPLPPPLAELARHVRWSTRNVASWLRRPQRAPSTVPITVKPQSGGT
jgi:hypothetical protein